MLNCRTVSSISLFTIQITRITDTIGLLLVWSNLYRLICQFVCSLQQLHWCSFIALINSFFFFIRIHFYWEFVLLQSYGKTKRPTNKVWRSKGAFVNGHNRTWGNGQLKKVIKERATNIKLKYEDAWNIVTDLYNKTWDSNVTKAKIRKKYNNLQEK